MLTGLNAAQQTRDVEPVLVLCWASMADCEPALDQHWVNIVFAGSADKCFAPKRNRKFRSIHSLYCPFSLSTSDDDVTWSYVGTAVQTVYEDLLSTWRFGSDVSARYWKIEPLTYNIRTYLQADIIGYLL